MKDGVCRAITLQMLYANTSKLLQSTQRGAGANDFRLDVIQKDIDHKEEYLRSGSIMVVFEFIM